MSLSESIISILGEFESVFSRPTWKHVEVLIEGTLLARGRRTVASALRASGHGDDQHFSSYHQVMNRAVWSLKELSRRLLCLLVRTFIGSGGRITIVVDETLERRWGRQISKRGHFRDPLKSSRKRSVSSSGLRWIEMALVVRLPWTERDWALPFMGVMAPSPETSKRLGVCHKTVQERARQMMMQVRRWLPDMEITMVGDGAYSVIELAERCQKEKVRLVAPLRLDARLYEPPPRKKKNPKGGRPRVKGKKLPKLSEVLVDQNTSWQRVRVRWYDRTWRMLEVATGTALWHGKQGHRVLVRWVLVRDPKERVEPRAFFSTEQSDKPQQIITEFIKRWTVETTFEESRAHLGIETQRQWSDKAIDRETPCLLGLYSLVALLANAIHPEADKMPIQQTAWYAKRQATFADALACVRSNLWGNMSFETSISDGEVVKLPHSEFQRLLNTLRYSH